MSADVLQEVEQLFQSKGIPQIREVRLKESAVWIWHHGVAIPIFVAVCNDAGF